MSTSDDGRLSRWSRRKAESRSGKRGRANPVALDEPAEAEIDLAPPPDDSALSAVVGDEAGADVGEDDLSEEERAAIVAELPDIETLDKESDFTPFLKKGVPEDLTRMALRKLWLSDTVFANLDGLAEYDHDYNALDKLISMADTNYKVGKGFLAEDGETEQVAETETAESGGEGSDDPDSPELAKSDESAPEKTLGNESEDDEDPELG